MNGLDSIEIVMDVAGEVGEDTILYSLESRVFVPTAPGGHVLPFSKETVWVAFSSPALGWAPPEIPD